MQRRTAVSGAALALLAIVAVLLSPRLRPVTAQAVPLTAQQARSAILTPEEVGAGFRITNEMELPGGVGASRQMQAEPPFTDVVQISIERAGSMSPTAKIESFIASFRSPTITVQASPIQPYDRLGGNAVYATLTSTSATPLAATVVAWTDGQALALVAYFVRSPDLATIMDALLVYAEKQHTKLAGMFPAAAQPAPSPLPAATPTPQPSPSAAPEPAPSPSPSPPPETPDPKARLVTAEELGGNYVEVFDGQIFGSLALRVFADLRSGEVVEVVVGPFNLGPDELLESLIRGLSINATVTQELRPESPPAGFGADAFQASGIVEIEGQPTAITVIAWTQGSLSAFAVAIAPSGDSAREAALRIATRQRDKLTGFVGAP